MVNPISSAGHAADAGRSAANLGDVAQGARTLIDGSRQLGVVNAELLAKDLAQVVAHDPKRAAELLAEIKPQLSAADQQRLTRELSEEVDAGLAKQKTDLTLDLVQIGLSIAGIFDPTPISDGIDGLISLFRGDFLGAGISAVSMIPYIGDAAKLGKLGKFAETIAKAVDLAKVDPAFAKAIEPTLKKIAEALDQVPMDSLPKPAREALEAMKTKIDELFAATRSVSAKVGRNDVKWTVDANGQTVKAEATLREVFPGAKRSSAETTAQGQAAAAGAADDVGGHIVGHRFVKDQGEVNLFPQNVQFNNSAYRKLENEWADWIKQGKEVQIDVQLSGGTAARPDKIDVFYKVVDPATGKTVYKDSANFANQAGQTFDRLPRSDIKTY
jgi:DNA/RNA non-specific endonuclease